MSHKSVSGEHKHSSYKNMGPSHEPPDMKPDFLENKYNKCHEISIIFKYNWTDNVYIKITTRNIAAKTHAWEIMCNIVTCRLIAK
jgi:precorrin-4 methylase